MASKLAWTNVNLTAATVKTGMVVARHQYESGEALFTYLFQLEKDEWKLLAFKPGDHLPGAIIH